MRRAVVFGALLFVSAQASRAETKSDFSADQTRKVMASVGRCAAQGEPKVASEYALGKRAWPTGSGDVLVRCLSAGVPDNTLMLPHPALLYIVADGLIRQDFSKAMPDIANRAPLPDLEQVRAPEQLRWRADPRNAAKVLAQDDRDRSVRVLAKVSECVVRREDKAVYDLLITEPVSDGEKAAFGSVSKVLSQCIDEGLKISLDKFNLRGSLAVVFYRLANAPVETPVLEILDTYLNGELLSDLGCDGLRKTATLSNGSLPCVPAFQVEAKFVRRYRFDIRMRGDLTGDEKLAVADEIACL